MCPGKNMRRNPAIPTWDPRRIPGGIPPFSGGIPTGIMKHPVWDPTRDYGTFRVVSHPGLWNIPCGIPHGIPPQISDSFPPGKSFAGGIAPGILQISVWTLPKITDGFQLDILGKILRGILPNTRDHRVIKYTRKNILPISLEPNPSN